MDRALILGGSGQLGLAVARALLDGRWQVDVAVRGGRPLAASLAGATRLDADGRTRAQLVASAPEGYAAVFDPTAYDAADAADLLARQDRVGAYCVVSSSSVYRDARGRTLDEAADTGFPDFAHPPTEADATVGPGEATYSTRKIAMERAMRAAGVPVAILRPAAVYGVGALHPREWWFVKRALDGRRRVPLAFDGHSVLHTSSTTGIASLARICFERRVTGTFNVADPRARSVAEIASAIGTALGHDFVLDPFAGPPLPPAFVGRSPWSAARPFRIDTGRARSLGWDGGPGYAEAIAPFAAWLVETAGRGDWRDAFPQFRTYAYDPFDYAAEDAQSSGS